MRALIASVLAGAAAAMVSVPSHAAPAPVLVAPAESAITLIDGGCGGPQFYRAPNGYCYRKPGYYGSRPPPPPPPGYYAPRPPPPPGYARPCPPGYHPTPYGCRPNF